MTYQRKTLLLLFATGSACALLGTAGAAAAQELAVSDAAAARSAGTQLEEITVTARKQSESLMTVPVAVTAMDGAALERRSIANLQQIAQMAPQLSVVQGNSGNGATFSMRGLGSSFLDSGLEQTVSVNIDGMQVSRGHIISQAFFDIAQIEVLKGPQALFFGKNSPAGVVSITTNNPGETFEGSVRAGYEFEAHERYLEAVVGGPISSTLRARFAIRGSQMDGFLRNTAGPGVWAFSPGLIIPGLPVFQNPGFEGHQPANKNLVGRATFVWEPTSDFQATLKLQAGHDRNNGINGLDQPVCLAGQTVPRSGGGPGGVGSLPDPYGDCTLDHNRSGGRLPAGAAVNYPGANSGVPYGETNAYLASLSLKYDLGDLTLNSVTGYFKLDTAGFDTLDNTSLSAATLASSENDKSFSQEFRVSSAFDGPLNFTAGAYYENVKYTSVTSILLGFAGVPALPDPRTGSYNISTRVSPNKNEAVSLFAQGRWKLTPVLELAAGARWTHETKDSSSINAFVNQAFPLNFILVPEGVRVGGKVKDSNVSPEVTLSWNVNPDTLIYASYRTGYKSGGISNPQLLSANYTLDSLEFAPEKVKGGEIGLKASLLNNSMRLQLGAYRYDYDNLQLSIFENTTSSFIIKNAASARVKGVEASVDWRPLPELTIAAAVGYNKARYISYPNGPCNFSDAAQCVNNQIDLSGQPLARAPDWSGNVGAIYDLPLTSDLKLAFSVDMDFTSSFFSDDYNEPLLKQDAFQRWNAGIRLHQADERWELALIARNLGDKVIAAYTTSNIGGPPSQYNVNTVRPREITLQAAYRF